MYILFLRDWLKQIVNIFGQKIVDDIPDKVDFRNRRGDKERATCGKSTDKVKCYLNLDLDTKRF